jgi:hypothetical protein
MTLIKGDNVYDQECKRAVDAGTACRLGLLQSINGAIEAVSSVGVDFDETHAEADTRAEVHHLSLHGDLAFFWQVDLQHQVRPCPLLVRGIDEAAAAAQVVEANGRVEQPHAAAVKRTGDALELSVRKTILLEFAAPGHPALYFARFRLGAPNANAEMCRSKSDGGFDLCV